MTNLCALQYFDCPTDVPETSRFSGWFNCTINEMKAYVGLYILMGLCEKLIISDYWSLHPKISAPGFCETMLHNRF